MAPSSSEGDGWNATPSGAITSRSTSGASVGGAAIAGRAARSAAVASTNRPTPQPSISIIGAALFTRALPGGTRVTRVHEICELRIARRHALHDRDLGREAQHDVGGRQVAADEVAVRTDPAFHIGEMGVELLGDARLERRRGFTEPRKIGR